MDLDDEELKRTKSDVDNIFVDLGYKKYDNHPELCKSNEWTTQDCRYIEYIQEDEKNNVETIRFDIDREEPIVWISAIRCCDGRKQRIPAPLNFKEIEAIYKKFKELL